ncbi:hypothetical protein SLA2020_302710 [Shorea laevis]
MGIFFLGENGYDDDSTFLLWLQMNCTKATPSPSIPVQWGTLFSFVIWIIWLQRNEKIYRPQSYDPNRAKSLIKERAMEFTSTFPYSTTVNRSLVCNNIKWDKPPDGYFKLNTDGSSLRTSRATACGGLIKDSLGRWVVGFARNVGITFALGVEFWGVQDGLIIARDWDIQNIIMEMDSLIVFKLLSNYDSINHPFHTMILECRELMAQIPHVRLQHIFREANQCADNLAAIGHTVMGFVYFDNCPQGLGLFLDADVRGISFPWT